LHIEANYPHAEFPMQFPAMTVGGHTLCFTDTTPKAVGKAPGYPTSRHPDYGIYSDHTSRTQLALAWSEIFSVAADSLGICRTSPHRIALALHRYKLRNFRIQNYAPERDSADLALTYHLIEAFFTHNL